MAKTGNESQNKVLCNFSIIVNIQNIMRINKYLAEQGRATRRAADELVKKGLVLINGRVAVLGDQVETGDKVDIMGSAAKKKDYKYFIYHKPRGEVTASPLKGLFYVGRLDKNSTGLLLLTNDGRVTDRLLNPKREHDKEYLVTTAQPLRPSFKKHMEAGVNIGDAITKKCRVEVIGQKTFKIILTEGKKHQIRRMCAALHNDVTELKRTRIMSLKLGALAPGASREFTPKEAADFLSSLGLSKPSLSSNADRS